MPKMKIAVVPKPRADFELQEREIPQPPAGYVRIRVQACGICFSDHLVKDGLFPGIAYPRSPGHEVAGIIDEVGPGVTIWKKGQRVGVGWHGGRDETSRRRRRVARPTPQRRRPRTARRAAARRGTRRTLAPESPAAAL